MNPLANILEQIEAHNAWQETIEVKRNDYLFKAGNIHTDLYLVESGCLHVFLEQDYAEQTIRFAYQNSFFGALDSFINDIPTIYSVQALRKSKLKGISKHSFMHIVHESDQNLKDWQEVMSQIIISQMERELH